MKIGLFFGTYNPVHIGHMAIANYMAEFTDLDQIWMVVTPLNPFKKKQSMLKDFDRLHLVNIAINENAKIKASDIEFNLPQPNYTSDTLAYLSEKFPEYQFALIMGEDNLSHFHKWKNHENILDQCQLYVYPRIQKEENYPLQDHAQVVKVDAPIMNISSSFIRNAIKENKEIDFFMPSKVANYVNEMNYYK